MIKEVIVEAQTIEQARTDAVTLLNAPETADVKFDIISMPQKKLFGLFGGSNAKIRAYYEDGKQEKKEAPVSKPAAKQAQPAPAPAKEPRPAPKKAPKEQKPAAPAVKKEAPAAAPEKKEPAAKVVIPADIDTTGAVAYLKEILGGMKVDNVQVQTIVEEETLRFEIVCEDYGIIIGRRGETLDALQYLVSLYMNKNVENYIRVSLNVGNYREKREDTLRALANKNANHVLRSGRRVILEPMNPYERRIIHTTIQKMEGVTSRSVGSNNDRKVIIELEEGFKPTGGSGNYSRGGRSDYNRRGPRRDNRERPDGPKSEPPRKLDKSELPKFGKIQ